MVLGYSPTPSLGLYTLSIGLAAGVSWVLGCMGILGVEAPPPP